MLHNVGDILHDVGDMLHCVYQVPHESNNPAWEMRRVWGGGGNHKYSIMGCIHYNTAKQMNLTQIFKNVGWNVNET